MKNGLRLLTLVICSLLSWSAGAQVYPNIPANTVLGRLGSGNPGPPQPIPFSVFNGTILSTPGPIGSVTPNTGVFSSLGVNAGAGLTNRLTIGDAYGSTTNLPSLIFSTYTDGNNYLDFKSHTAGSTYFRYGAGTGTGSANTWLTLDNTTGGLVFNTSTYPVWFQGNDLGDTAFFSPLINSLNNFIGFTTGTGPGGVGTAISVRRQNGTDASPTATLSGDELFFLQAYAWDGASFSQSVPPAVVISATENWTASAHGSSVMFQGVPNTTTTGQVEMSVGNGLVLQNTGVVAVQGNGRGTLLVEATTASSSTTTGAAVIDGGLGIAGALFGTTGSFSTSLSLNGVLGWTVTAPTVASGFCSSGSPVTTISASNGTAAFDILIGQSTCGSTGTLTMPSARTAWMCSATDVTTPASHNIVQTGPTSTTTASVVLTDYARVAGTAQNFNPADHIHVMCVAY